MSGAEHITASWLIASRTIPLPGCVARCLVCPTKVGAVTMAQVSGERDAEAARADRAEAAVAGMERRHRRELRAGSREVEEAHRALQELSQRCRQLEADAKRLRGRQQDTRRSCAKRTAGCVLRRLTCRCSINALLRSTRRAGIRFRSDAIHPVLDGASRGGPTNGGLALSPGPYQVRHDPPVCCCGAVRPRGELAPLRDRLSCGGGAAGVSTTAGNIASAQGPAVRPDRIRAATAGKGGDVSSEARPEPHATSQPQPHATAQPPALKFPGPRGWCLPASSSLWLVASVPVDPYLARQLTLRAVC